MEIHFEQKQVSCLKQMLRQLQTGEVTQEIRLPEEMPDVGRIIAGWGQMILRSKEWRGDSISCSGGIMCRMLYEPEEEGTPQVLESWLPFQQRWNLEDGLREGSIRLQCLCRSVDARSVSARKIMVRCSYGILAEATREQKVMVPVPGEVPEDVRMKIGRYPIRLPREAGEKQFLTEETLGPVSPKPEKIVACSMDPKISDIKIHGDKLSFRGNGMVHLTALSQEGMLYSLDLEVPFSQIAELEQSYGPDARGDVVMAMTSLDTELDPEGNLVLKASMAAQYMVDERQVLELVEDAYSTGREMQIQWESVELPVILEEKQISVPVNQTLRIPAEKMADVVYWPDFPVVRRNGSLEMEIPGMFQAVWYDEAGKLRSTQARTEEKWEGPAGDGCVFSASVVPSGAAAGTPGASITLNAEAVIRTQCRQDTGNPAVKALELGQPLNDKGRPSMVLCRAGGKDLWEMARENLSTVEAIRQINGLEAEPEPGKMLLIPVLRYICLEK